MANSKNTGRMTRRQRNEPRSNMLSASTAAHPTKFRPSVSLPGKRISVFALLSICFGVSRTFSGIRRAPQDDPPNIDPKSMRVQQSLQSVTRTFPRIVQYAKGNSQSIHNKTLRDKEISRRRIRHLGNFEEQMKIKLNDKIYLDPVEDDDCKLKHAWQKTSQPNCNMLHEWEPPGQSSAKSIPSKDPGEIVGNGFWRDVWVLYRPGDSKGVFKTMRFSHDYTPRNFDRMRRDAVTMERLTASKFVIDIYAFCGTSSLSQFGEGGDIRDAVWPKKGRAALTQLERLQIATQAAIGLASVHNVEHDGKAYIAHTDISSGQFIKVGNLWLLNDFNRARFLAWSKKNNTMCTYTVGNNPGKNRSPEEYNYDPQTEMVDVYSLGNVFYTLLQGESPFQDVSGEDAREAIKEGRRPTIYADLWNSTDPVNRALKEAMIMSHEQNPSDRASARDIELFLRSKMEQLYPGDMETWVAG